MSPSAMPSISAIRPPSSDFGISPSAVIGSAELSSGTRPPGLECTGIAQGPISTFGSVVVNGVRYDTSSATFTINGTPGTQDDLSVGQVITISGGLG